MNHANQWALLVCSRSIFCKSKYGQPNFHWLSIELASSCFRIFGFEDLLDFHQSFARFCRFVELCRGLLYNSFFGACGGCLRYYRLIWMCGLFELFELNGRREIDSALFICFDSTNKSLIFYPNVCNIAITKTRLLNRIYSPEEDFI